jgi:hypothetical protein
LAEVFACASQSLPAQDGEHAYMTNIPMQHFAFNPQSAHRASPTEQLFDLGGEKNL